MLIALDGAKIELDAARNEVWLRYGTTFLPVYFTPAQTEVLLELYKIQRLSIEALNDVHGHVGSDNGTAKRAAQRTENRSGAVAGALRQAKRRAKAAGA